LRLRVTTLCRTAPRSTSAQVRLGILIPAAVLFTSPYLPVGVQYVEGQDIHAGDHAAEGVTFGDG